MALRFKICNISAARMLVCLLINCFWTVKALAVEEPYINELKGSQIAANNFFTVSDEKFNNSTSWNLIRQNLTTDNIVTFEINFDTTVFFYNTPFDCTVNFKIYIYGNQSDTSQITDSTTHSSISLTVHYDTVAGKPYKGIAMYKFNGAYKYKVKILSVTSAQLGSTPVIFRLKGQIIVNRQYKFQDNSTDVTRFSKVNGNQLKLEWTPSGYPGAEMFDLEYTFIDSSSQIASSIRTYNTGGYYYVPADSLSKWFKNNNTRITTAASGYMINVAIDSGYVLFRLRGVQDSLGIRIEGNWNYAAKDSAISCTTSCPSGAVFFPGHEVLLNWQYSEVFAEEGKRKEVISYFDGTLRNRQSVTLSNTENKNIVQETIYDALGRPTLNILPAPTLDSTIHYFRGFNKNSGGTNPYSFSDLAYSKCATTADFISDTSGTGKYYSTGNSFLSNYYNAKYIPNAGGYPFAVTEYMADNTGRIKAQGGVGPSFQLGSNHETRYFYGKPTQTELDRLFGLEAGNASHYLKNMVVDPNGQISVSYMDASGNTIATALAGGAPANMHELPSSSGASVNVSNDIILPGDFTRNPGDNSMTASATFLAPVTGTYVFDYKIDSLTYRKLYGANKDSSICSNCYYDLEVLVKDNCETILRRDTVAAGNVFDTTCNSPPASIKDSIHVSISKIGEYYVTFNLHVSRDAMDYYDSVHLVKNTDIKKLNYFLLEELKQTDFYGCYNNCKTCYDKLGTKAEFTTNFKSLYTSGSVSFLSADSLWVDDLYDSLYANCQAIQSGCSYNVCDEKLAILKRDVSPGGQYALFDSSYTLLETPINALSRRSTLQWFPDENGNRDSVILVNQNGEDSIKVDVKQLSDSNFIKYWKDSWADSLVKLHPEYCFYLWCTVNSGSYEFDRTIEDWMDADTAIAKGWFSTSVYDTIMAHDPFFLYGGNGYSLRNKMRDSLRLFSRTLVGYSQSDRNILNFIDLILYCKKDSGCHVWEGCKPDSACRSRNKEWFLYKQFYLNLKQKFYEVARRTSTDTTFSHCKNCFIGYDMINQTDFICTPPPLTDFQLSDHHKITLELYYLFVKYKNGTDTVKHNYLIKLAYDSSGISPAGYDYVHFYKGHFTSDTLQYDITQKDNYRVVDISCDTTSYTPFVDTTCVKSCAAGNYNPYDRDSILFHIEFGNPNIAPSSVPSGYGNCHFYPSFTLHTGAADTAYCKFLNVWVCTYDSTCGGVCSDSTYPSQCSGGANDSLYANKIRRYPEYVNTAQLMAELQTHNPQQSSGENETEILTACHATCDAQADIWMNILRRCNSMSSSDSTALRAALVDICSKGCSINNPFGTSSIPNSISATYHSFEEAITAIIGSPAPNDSCTQELMAMPYPYNKQPAYTDQLISETDSAICAKINSYKTTWQGSGYSGSFHSWLKIQLGHSYQLDSLELDDLLNSCTNCNYLLKNDVILPVPFMGGAPPCLNCDSVQAALTAFNTKFPSIDTLSDDYETLFTNFFNHRFGYSLTYYQYKDFLDSCDAHSGSYTVKLCDEPMQQDITTDQSFVCTAELFAGALTSAYNTYVVYIDSVRRDFQEAWMTKCMNAQPKLTMTADLYEYHYTLYYYDQSGNLVKTVPPEGVQLLDNTSIAQVQAFRTGSNPYCSNNNAMVFTNGSVNFPGGTNAPQVSVGSGNFTIECWIKLSSYSDQGIISNNHYVPSFFFPHDYGYALDLYGGKLNIAMAEAAASDKLEAESPSISSFIALNSWTHIAVERTGISTVKMFINGNQVPVTNTVNSANTGNLDHGDTDPLYVGASLRYNTLTKLSSSKLRHVRIYTRALPATEIRQNFNNYCGNPSNHHALVFWETFTEGVFTASGGNDYVYDRIYSAAGQKSGTIAFETTGSNTLVPEHRLVTTYQYNSLNQVLQQYSPDGDTSVFFYDKLGRLTASQNKEQKDNSSYSGDAGRFSYTKYDSLGRITEVGEKSTSTDIRTINMLKPDSVTYWLGTGTNRQLTKTIYDDPVNINLQDYNTSRKRVVASIYLENSGDGEGDSTLYSYDILGNVKTLLQHVKALVAVDNTNGGKRIDYSYDLVSGKVNMVSYQSGKGDQFFYKYSYDADNRVIRSYSSRDKLLWIEDASYNYYLHGPLARTELGQYKVQGIDYVYTLQGWLKGINSDSLSYLYDMANDGKQGATFARVSRDVYGFKLGYYNGDYTAIGGSSADAFIKKAYTAPSSLDYSGDSLFNGNISYSTLALSKISSAATTGYSYGYDQLNRLTEMRQHTTGTTGGWSNSNIITAYRESITYDANGNILKYLRKGNATTPHMDSLTYKYTYSSGNLVNNKLNHVNDSIPSGNYSVDIDNQSADNYVYDKIGNLKKDVAESIDTIRWTVYGKINRIIKSSGATLIDYKYDPEGNRTSKKVTVSGDTTTTFYIRDAQGNVLGIYSKKNSVAIHWDEQHLYGSSRLGMWNWDTIVPSAAPVVVSDPIYDSLMLGSRTYELTNHLGNVLSTISDKKIGNDSSGTVNYYIAEVLSQNDYYPFGMLQPGRSYSAGNQYRYGFNGKENDNEVKGEGNQQDYGLRVYDPRLGKFLSVDQLTRSYPMLTPYQFSSNDPIESVDLDGQERVDFRIIKRDDGSTQLQKISESSKTEDLSWGPFPNTVTIPYHVSIEYNGKSYLFIDRGSESDLAQGRALPVASKYNSYGPFYYAKDIDLIRSDPDKFAETHEAAPEIDYHDWYVIDQKVGAITAAAEALAGGIALSQSGEIESEENYSAPSFKVKNSAVLLHSGSTEASESNTVSVPIIKKVNRTGGQSRLREIAIDPKTSSANRGWIKQEINQIDRQKRTTIRRPPGMVLAHTRGREAAKGFSYAHSNLQTTELHKLQHIHDQNGTLNKVKPIHH